MQDSARLCFPFGVNGWMGDIRPRRQALARCPSSLLGRTGTAAGAVCTGRVWKAGRCGCLPIVDRGCTVCEFSGRFLVAGADIQGFAAMLGLYSACYYISYVGVVKRC